MPKKLGPMGADMTLTSLNTPTGSALLSGCGTGSPSRST